MIVAKRMNKTIKNTRDTRQESIFLIIENPTYSPKNTHMKLLPQRQNPAATKTILKTQLMLIGSEVNRCFLFFSMLSIIFDIFLCCIGAGWSYRVSEAKRRFVFSCCQFFAIKYNPQHSVGVEIFCKIRRA